MKINTTYNLTSFIKLNVDVEAELEPEGTGFWYDVGGINKYDKPGKLKITDWNITKICFYYIGESQKEVSDILFPIWVKMLEDDDNFKAYINYQLTKEIKSMEKSCYK